MNGVRRRHGSVFVLRHVLMGVLAVTAGVRVTAQSSTVQQRAQLLTYVVPAARSSAFEQVIDMIVARLSAASPDRALLPFTLRVFRAVQDDPSRSPSYQLLIEPPVSGTDSPLEAIIAGVWPADESLRVIQQLRDAIGGAVPVQTLLETIRTVTPLDALRNRLDIELSGVPSSGSGARPPDDAKRIEQLRQPLWAVDDVRYEILDPTGGNVRIRWSANVRNPSLVRPLFGRMTVVFRDGNGTAISTTAPIAIQLDPQMWTAVSGEVTLSRDAAARITAASGKVDVTP